MASVNVSFSQQQPLPKIIPARRVAFPTLGCKVNIFESEMLAEKIVGNQYRRVDASEQADLYIINTCTVTAEADRQARQLVRRVVRQNPDAWVVVSGCYAQMSPQTCAEIPGVDLVVGNSQKLAIPELLDDLYQGNLAPILLQDIDHEISLPDQLLQGFEGHSRAFVQIQQGCDQGCTFCIIHTARGRNRSFSPAMIKRQCQRLIMNGYGEIVLCGVDVGSYGADFEDAEIGLTELLRLLLELNGTNERTDMLYRLRLSSIDPAHITDEFIDLLAQNPGICPQLHLSLQSANTLILKRMKRRATKKLIYERIGALRSALPELVLSADILVGFPTESEAYFADTLLAIYDLEIAYPHVFRYSPRPGTPAARIPSQVPMPLRKSRAKAIRDAGEAVWERVAKRQIGQYKTVLVESANSKAMHPDSVADLGAGWIVGRADNYFPVKFQETRAAQSGDKAEYRTQDKAKDKVENKVDQNSIAQSCRWRDLKITGVGDKTLLGRVEKHCQ